MIIIEGPDGTGKTNLSRRLAEEIGLPLHERASTSIGGPVANLWDWVCNDVGSWESQPLTIYDRHPLISEYIYGPTVRGTLLPGFAHPSARGMLAKMAQQALIIFALPPLQTVIKNVANEEIPQLAGVAENTAQLYWLYTSRSASWPGWSVTYDYAVKEGKGSYAAVNRAVRVHMATSRKAS